MMYKTMIAGAAAAFFGTAQAVSHGDVQAYGDGNIRWQQVGDGLFTGVPESEWDDAGKFPFQTDTHRRL